MFDQPLADLPLRFTRYFVTVVNKTCARKEIIQQVPETSAHELAEQLLLKLVIDNLENIGAEKEGEIIMKNINSGILRMTEAYPHIAMFVIFFKLLRKYKGDP